MKKFVIAAAVVAFGSSAFAAGIDSRAYTCGGLNALIAQRGFVYIGIPFQNFAVSGANFCSGNERLEIAERSHKRQSAVSRAVLRRTPLAGARLAAILFTLRARWRR